MHAYHDSLTGHPGYDETVRKVLERFYWPRGQAWIEQYIKGCRCSQVVIFLPCLKIITGPQIAQLYYQHLYPWFGLHR